MAKSPLDRDQILLLLLEHMINPQTDANSVSLATRFKAQIADEKKDLNTFEKDSFKTVPAEPFVSVETGDGQYELKTQPELDAAKAKADADEKSKKDAPKSEDKK